MRRITSLALIAFGVLVAACGGGGGGDGGGGSDGSQFLGTYAIMSHTEAHVQGASVPCSDPGTPIAGARPYLKIEVDPFFMDNNTLTLVECTDAAAADCADTLVSLQAGGPGLESESANTQTGGGVMCQLYYSHAQATLDGTAVHIEALDKFAAPNLSSSDCTLARAEALADSPDCERVERWNGTRI